MTNRPEEPAGTRAGVDVSAPVPTGGVGGGYTTPWRHRHRDAVQAWIILGPILIYYVIFVVGPILFSLALSFSHWDGVSGPPRWAGVSNYLRYLQDPYPQIYFNTGLFAVCILAIQTVGGFSIALLLNEKLFGRSIHRTLWYIPSLTSAAIMAQVVVIFVSPYDGVLNRILATLGMDPIVWTADGFWSRVIIIVFSVWRGIGGPVVLFLAALQAIDPQLHEAAKVDGASARQRLFGITVPLMRPMIVFVVVTGMIGGFQIFEAVLLTTNGGPLNQTNVAILQLYNDAFVNAEFGVASAGTVIIALILLGFSLASLKSFRQGSFD